MQTGIANVYRIQGSLEYGDKFSDYIRSEEEIAAYID